MKVANSSPKTFDEAVRMIAEEVANLLIAKEWDYGKGNLHTFGELGILVRASDKLARLRNLLWNCWAPRNESVEDSWRDLAGYAILALMYHRGWYDLPLSGRDIVLVEERREGMC